MADLLLTGAEVAPGVKTDLRIADGLIADRGRLVPTPRDTVVPLDGRATVPGLVDHHVHLMALAASRTSVDCAPPRVGSIRALVEVLVGARAEQPEGWLRGTGYDVALAGAIDRRVLDRHGAGPVRVQDRTATWWVLSSDGLDLVLPDDPASWPPGVCVDAAGRPTGVLVRLDGWLRTRLGRPADTAGRLTAVGQQLAGWGVTSVHDASATNGSAELALLDGAALPQRITAMTGGLDVRPVGSITLGPVKVVLDDADLPTLEALSAHIAACHGRNRTVAIHCVTAVQLLVAVAALDDAGRRAGDRIEHASVVPGDVLAPLRRLAVTVVTQPGLVWSRGDRYLEEVEDGELPSLYRIATLRRAGVRVLGSTDAPFGPADPWIGIRAATDRRTAGGHLVSVGEVVGPRAAVDLFTGTRRLRPGQPADVCILDGTWSEVTARPSVRATLIAGHQVHGAPLA